MERGLGLLLVVALVVSACASDAPVAGRAEASDVENAAVTTSIDGLTNPSTAVAALGSVWVVTSNAADRFSQGEVESTVVRIDPSSRRVHAVLESPGLEPSLVAAGGHVWVTRADGLVALSHDGTVQRSIAFDLGTSHGLATDGELLWLVVGTEDRIVAIDPSTTEIVTDLELGPFPNSPLAAFGFVWVADLINGTVTALPTGDARGEEARSWFVTDRPKSMFAVSNSATGEEIWITNVEGEVYAVSASTENVGQVRPVRTDRPINQVIAAGDRVVLLPTWGTAALVFDPRADTLLAELPLDSIPVRGLAIGTTVWVTGDGTSETLSAIDTPTATLRLRLDIGSNDSETTGPQTPIAVGEEIWVPNRGDDTIVIVGSGS